MLFEKPLQRRLFSEYLKLIRACSKRFFEKNLVLPILAKKCQKLAVLTKMPKMEVFRIFLAISSLEFADFVTRLCMCVSLSVSLRLPDFFRNRALGFSNFLF